MTIEYVLLFLISVLAALFYSLGNNYSHGGWFSGVVYTLLSFVFCGLAIGLALSLLF